MRPVTRAALVPLLAALSACASGVGSTPPGGREDHAAPMIASVTPDTGTTNFKGKEMTVEFDEVIGERPSTGATLADVVLISPRDGQPEVDWHRRRITIRPRNKWRPDMAYTVTIRPGITDLRNNVRNTTTEILFSTGSVIPKTTVAGRIFDWVTGLPARNGIVEVVARNDTTLVYFGVVDSTGAFALRGIRPASYLVRGYIDDNHNLGFDPRESFDTTGITLADSARLELLAFLHDSTGPSIGIVATRDTNTVHVTFDSPIDPSWQPTPTAFRVVGPDSAVIPIVAVTADRPDTTTKTLPPRPLNSSLPPRPVAPTTARDTTRPRPSKPLLYRGVTITLGARLHPRGQYTLHAYNVRAPGGIVRTSERSFTVPAELPRQDAGRRDTTATPRR